MSDKSIDEYVREIKGAKQREEVKQGEAEIIALLINEQKFLYEVIANKNNKIGRLESMIEELLKDREENKSLYATIHGLNESIKAQTIKIKEKDLMINKLINKEV